MSSGDGELWRKAPQAGLPRSDGAGCGARENAHERPCARFKMGAEMKGEIRIFYPKLT